MTEKKLDEIRNISEDINSMSLCLIGLKKERLYSIKIKYCNRSERFPSYDSYEIIPNSIKDEAAKMLSEFISKKLEEYKKEFAKL